MNATSAAAARGQTTAPADLTAVKTRQQGAWASGDYAVVGTTLQIVGEQLCEALDLRPGQRVLDVAAGNGNVTLAAARRWCRVTSTDFVPSLLERARERAAAERLEVEFQQADAEALPFADDSFDAVVSTFGVMFTPHQERAAAELIRVCRPGGKIGLANWTPDSMIGKLFKIIGQHLPPPAGVRSPSLWGTEPRIAEMFGRRAAGIQIERRALAGLRVPLPLGGALARRVPDLLRAAAEGVRRARAAGTGGAGQGHARPGAAAQPLRRRDDGGAQRVPGDRDHQALTCRSQPPPTKGGGMEGCQQPAGLRAKAAGRSGRRPLSRLA
jgi:SAM-dependent methyltransferase